MSSALKQTIIDAMKTAMKAGDKPRLGTIRLTTAALKQVEVDTRKELTDADVLSILDKMVKQRRDSLKQYQDAGREDLAEQEAYEIEVLQDFLPQPLSEDEIQAMIQAALDRTGACAIADMGKVMGLIKPQAQGRADLGKISALVRARLNT